MRVGNYPTENGDIDYLETDNISQLRNVLSNVTSISVDDNSCEYSFTILYDGDNQEVVLNMQKEHSIERIPCEQRIAVDIFADCLSYAIEHNVSLDNVDPISSAKENLINEYNLSQGHLMHETEYSVCGHIYDNNNRLIGLFNEVYFDKNNNSMMVNNVVMLNNPSEYNTKNARVLFYLNNELFESTGLHTALMHYPDQLVYNQLIFTATDKMSVTKLQGLVPANFIFNKQIVNYTDRDSIEDYYANMKIIIDQINGNTGNTNNNNNNFDDIFDE